MKGKKGKHDTYTLNKNLKFLNPTTVIFLKKFKYFYKYNFCVNSRLISQGVINFKYFKIFFYFF